MKIAYFGDTNSHTYAAAEDFVLKGFIPKDFGAVSKPSVKECFKAVLSGECDFSVVPLENSVEGAVTEALDSFTEFPVYIAAETVMPIKHNLIVLKDAVKSDIKQIFSHPQALGQCRKYLEANFPKADILAAKSTSDGIQRIRDKYTAAIGRRADGESLRVIEEGIQDYNGNSTRFVLLSPRPTFCGSKCGIIFDTLNEPGALLKVLTVLAEEKVNMTKIESRPAKTAMGRYIFFTDFTFSGDKAALNALLSKLSLKTGFIKFLGQY